MLEMLQGVCREGFSMSVSFILVDFSWCGEKKHLRTGLSNVGVLNLIEFPRV